ncbi:LPXTG cell wall anchor domain-containing protein [Enterococcus plantarum]|nr:LPXTG cell wall anchor domain-containing protein [Enterococcus plantarum]
MEKTAPNGFIVDTTPIPFELKYEGQFIELVSTSLPEAKNEFQMLKLTLHKDEEKIQNWENNIPIIENIKSNDKVFGLFTNEEMTFADKILEKDSLVNFGTAVEGNLTFENLQYPEGAYYFKELDAGDNHILDTEHYEFEFLASDNEVVKDIQIYNKKTDDSKEDDNQEETPLLNKLYFNQFNFKKINEVPILKEKDGYLFEFTANAQGAVFTLEDEENKIIQTVELGKDSIAHFENIPVGTFHLKEKKASAENYVLPKEVIRIESSKDRIAAYDEQDKLLGEQTIDSVIEKENEATEKDESVVTEPEATAPFLLFEVKNYLKKGTSELTKKDVSSGELLPNTGIQILDKDKKIVAEGTTNEDGVFTFKNLPYGTYYFKEFSAPANYLLDETPIKFEIKEDGKIVKCMMTNQKKDSPTAKPSPKQLPETGDKPRIIYTLIGLGLIGSTFVLSKIYRTKKQNKK